jgi:hypothetical protein
VKACTWGLTPVRVRVPFDALEPLGPGDHEPPEAVCTNSHEASEVATVVALDAPDELSELHAPARRARAINPAAATVALPLRMSGR